MAGMRAMVVEEPRRPLAEKELPDPEPAAGEVLIRVHACGVCRTDLHLVDGEIALHKRPVVPGHQVVGIVERQAQGSRFKAGDRVGVAWLAFACGVCRHCREGRENLCEKALFTVTTATVDTPSCLPPTRASATPSRTATPT